MLFELWTCSIVLIQFNYSIISSYPISLCILCFDVLILMYVIFEHCVTLVMTDDK